MNKITNFKFMDVGEELLTEDQAYFLKTFLDRTLKIGTELEWNLKKAEQHGNCRGDAKLCPCSNMKEGPDGRMCGEVCKIESSCAIAKKGRCPGIFCFKFERPCDDCTDWAADCKTCVFAWDPSKDPNGVRNLLKEEFVPSGSVAKFGKLGVHNIKTDGSLDGDGGLEIPTIGRRVDYYAFLKQFKTIYERVNELGGYMDERASIHYHLLVSYIGNHSSNFSGGQYSSIEEPIPGIFLRNFHQMFRVFHNPLIWISAAGISWKKLTRWAKFRESVIGISGVKHTAAEIKQHLEQKYKMISYRDCVVSDNQVKTFHIEARHCDGINSPTAAAALAMLLYGFAMKAVDMSMHGVFALPNAFYKKQKTISKILMNNNTGEGDYKGARHSSTVGIEEHAPELRLFTKQMIDFVKMYLKRWPEAIQVLYSLAETPCALRIMDKQDWPKIEAELNSIGEKKRDLKQPELEVLKIIDLCLICGENPEDWIKCVSKEVHKSKEDTNKAVKILSDEGLITWSGEDQSYTRA